MKKRVIATIVVAVIALSGITVAFAAKNDGLVGPKAILPGAITSMDIKDDDIKAEDIGGGEVGSSEIADGAVSNAKITTNAVNSTNIKNGEVGSSEIATDAVNGSNIANGTVANADIGTGAVKTGEIYDNTIQSIDIGPNIIPTAMNKTTTTLSTKDSYPDRYHYDPENTSWNTTIYLPPRDTDYNLSVYWTANDAWVDFKENALYVRCQLDHNVIGLNEYKILHIYGTLTNLTTSCVFNGAASGGSHTISIQIKTTNSSAKTLVGINEQNLFAVAYPRPA